MKKNIRAVLFLIFAATNILTVAQNPKQLNNNLPKWAMGDFVRPKGKNPIISPDSTSIFMCPLFQKTMKWEENDTFNPAATVINNKIVVLYRAEDKTGVAIGARTSRIGYAESKNGISMKKRPEPVLFPNNDMTLFDSPGGCEDPRVAVTEDGMYVMFYTGYDKKTARLCVATSRDLINWEKHGLIFEKAYNGRFKDEWSKAASIVTKLKDDALVITKVNGKYFMYWGEFQTYAATSDDLINWYPILNDENELKVLAQTRKGYFDSDLVECGPPSIITEDGILMLYNGKNSSDKNMADIRFPLGTYAAGQLLFDKEDPCKVIGRLDTPFFYPQESFEKSGQYKIGRAHV